MGLHTSDLGAIELDEVPHNRRRGDLFLLRRARTAIPGQRHRIATVKRCDRDAKCLVGHGEGVTRLCVMCERRCRDVGVGEVECAIAIGAV